MFKTASENQLYLFFFFSFPFTFFINVIINLCSQKYQGEGHDLICENHFSPEVCKL